MKFIFIIFIVLLQISCNNETEKNNLKKISIPESEFKIPICIQNNLQSPSINYKAKVLNPYWSCYVNFMRTSDTLDLHFQNTSSEIEFASYLPSDEIKFYKPGFCIIGCKGVKNETRCFVIFWVNKNQNSEEYLKMSQDRLKISNEIDATTDTIYTSLSKSIIDKCYPKFKGVYVNLKLDSISLGKYPADTYSFYHNIKFHNFNFGIGVKKYMNDH